MAGIKLHIDMKFLTLIVNGNMQDVLIEDVPDGLHLDRQNTLPIFPRRTQDGTLITQTALFNKKSFSLKGVENHTPILSFLAAAYEGAHDVAMTVYDVNESFTEYSEYTVAVRIIQISDGKDFIGNKKEWTVQMMEI